MRDSSRKNASGFSLIELLIVVAIIGIIAAIAVPNFLNSRQSAYNASAFSSLRLIHIAEIAYRERNSQYGDLNDLKNANLLSDPLLATGQRSNYTFTINPATLTPNYYEATANPSVAPWRFYYIDASGVIRSEMGGPANLSSSPISY
ncbi:MAG TPA: prepilin-type N-terminal cleavage/methylation domain-containing protein [Pyrinomonadaceae bacterium]|nr:prepilin-type N-terminal cleavage/methylation domain-containing protein [Pyrinomonadaceae bacterium]